jgi:DNA-binding transcriptional MocR family regulator
MPAASRPRPRSGIGGATALEIASSVEAAIREGRLRPGDDLPTVRSLAQDLRLSPTTVAAAFKELRARGLVSTQGRRGTRVCPRPPIYAGGDAPLPPGVRNLADGNPDPALLPDLAPALARIDTSRVLYGDALIEPELGRRAVERFRADGIPADRVSVTSGALDGLERVLQARLRPGDRVAVEDPAFVGVRDLLAALGLAAVPVEIDDEGPRPAALARALERGAAALVVTPRAQNPFGSALTVERADTLAAVLDDHPDVLLCEDDHAGIVAGAPVRTLVRPGVRHPWAVVRSFSKSLGPDLRVATVAGDDETMARVEGRQRLGIRWVSHVLQRLALVLWKDRSVQAGLRAAARTYTARREALLRALDEHGLEAHGRSGLCVWIPVAEEVRPVQALLEAGWAVNAGERFRLESGPGIRVCIATLEESEALQLARDIARTLEPSGRSAAT